VIGLAQDSPELTSLIYRRNTPDRTWRQQESITGSFAQPNPAHAGRIFGSARFGVYMSFFHELRRRKVAQVAAVYLVVAWLIAQVIDVVNDPLSLPPWFATVVLVLLGVGFPIAVIFAWIFDITPQGVIRTADDAVSPTPSSRLAEYVLLGVIAIGIGWLIARDSVESSTGSGNDVPVVVLMDTSAPRGVYDQETRDASGTNADVLSDQLRDLPVLLQKEAIGAAWDREDQVLRQSPDLVLIHRSGFFHPIAQELGLVYPDDAENFDEQQWSRTYAIADDKLIAFLGFVGIGNPNTKFLVYSRGTGGEFAGENSAWVASVEGRFPVLSGRVHAMMVPGGIDGGGYRRPDAISLVRQRVRDLLKLEKD